MAFTNMAEGVRFELTVGYKPTLVFKTSAFNRSASPPKLYYLIISMCYVFLLKLLSFIGVNINARFWCNCAWKTKRVGYQNYCELLVAKFKLRA